MKNPVCYSLLSALLVLSFSASADGVRLRGYFPAHCDGQPSKALVAYEARTEAQGRDLEVRFKVALMECLEGAQQFVSYLPRAEEYVQIYEIVSTGMPALKFPLGTYPEGKTFTEVAFVLPSDKLQGTVDYRVDIFLYQAKIPLKLTLSETGEALITGGL